MVTVDHYLEFQAGRGTAFAEFNSPAQGIVLFQTRFRVPSGTNNNQGRSFFFTLEDGAGNIGFSLSYDGPLGSGRLVDVDGAGRFTGLPPVQADTWHQLLVNYNGSDLIVTMDTASETRSTPRSVSGTTRIRIHGRPDTSGGSRQ